MKFDKAGIYKVLYRATDECGEVSEQTRTIEVIDVPKKTVRYADRTLIINELATNRDYNISIHGNVVDEYAPLDDSNPYIWDSANEVLWKERRTVIESVEFGSPIAPYSLGYWFQEAKNLACINWFNFDGSNVTTARAFLSGTKMPYVTLPAMPNLTSIQFICNKCEELVGADFSAVKSSNIDNTTDAFQGCYALEQVDISSLAGTVDKCERMFANINNDGKGDMKLKTIIADPELDFEQASKSDNMFRSCTSLVGGNGTTYDPLFIDKTYARVDMPEEQRGYFTMKVGVSNK